MKLPELDQIKSKAAVINEFRGINDNVFIPDNFVKTENNMTSDFYPAMASRQEREVININGELKALVEVNGNTVYANNTVLKIMDKTGTNIKSYNYNIDKIYRYGAYIICMPEKKMVNTAYDSTDPNSKEVINLETVLEFSMNKKCNMYLSDKDAVPFVCLPENGNNSFIGSYTEEGMGAVAAVRLHDGWLNAYATTGESSVTFENKSINIGKANVILPSFIKTKTITYTNNLNSITAKPINVLFGSKNSVKNADQGTHYDCYFGAVDDNKIAIKEYNRTTAMWSTPTLYLTLWIQDSTYVSSVKENIKKGDYIKLLFKDANEAEYTKDTSSSEASYEFYQRFKNYVKVENVLYDNNQAGIVFQAGNILEILKEKGFMKYGSTGSQDEFIPSVYDLRTIIGCPSGDGSIGVNLCNKLTVAKDMPDMDYITIADNRVWGCSNEKHEIYCCKLGDPSNWHCYSGAASDAYAMTIGTNGDFTGAYTYMGKPYFFKEDLVINIFGDKPSNYQLNEIYENGIESNSPDSIAEINGYMYYKSRQGIVRFNGNNTTVISEPLGQYKFYNAKAGASDWKYFVSMKKLNETKSLLYVYDTRTDTWHIEDDVSIDYFYKIKDSVYAVKKGNVSKMYRLSGYTSMPDTMNALLREDLAPEITKECENYVTSDFTLRNHGISFFAETGDIESGIENIYIQKVGIRFEIAKDAYIRILIKYDNAKYWNEAFIHTGKKEMDAVNVTLRPHRCKKFNLRIEGQGLIKIHEIQRIINEGSDKRYGYI